MVMDLKELTNLIQVRNYLSDTMGNSAFDRATVSEMNGSLILIDKKIVEIIKSNSFKNYINWNDVKSAVENVARINNIKYNINK